MDQQGSAFKVKALQASRSFLDKKTSASNGTYNSQLADGFYSSPCQNNIATITHPKMNGSKFSDKLHSPQISSDNPGISRSIDIKPEIKKMQSSNSESQKSEEPVPNKGDPRNSSDYELLAGRNLIKTKLKPVQFEIDRHTIRESPKIGVVISNLSPLTTYNNINDFFAEFGKVADILMPRDPFTGMSMGIALIEFSHSQSHFHPVVCVKNLFSSLGRLEAVFQNSKLTVNSNRYYDNLVLQTQNELNEKYSKDSHKSKKNSESVAPKSKPTNIPPGETLKNQEYYALKIRFSSIRSKRILDDLLYRIKSCNLLYFFNEDSKYWYLIFTSQLALDNFFQSLDYNSSVMYFIQKCLRDDNKILDSYINKHSSKPAPKKAENRENAAPAEKLEGIKKDQSVSKGDKKDYKKCLIFENSKKQKIIDNLYYDIVDELCSSLIADIKKRLLSDIVSKIFNKRSNVFDNATQSKSNKITDKLLLGKASKLNKIPFMGKNQSLNSLSQNSNIDSKSLSSIIHSLPNFNKNSKTTNKTEAKHSSQRLKILGSKFDTNIDKDSLKPRLSYLNGMGDKGASLDLQDNDFAKSKYKKRLDIQLFSSDFSSSPTHSFSAEPEGCGFIANISKEKQCDGKESINSNSLLRDSKEFTKPEMEYHSPTNGSVVVSFEEAYFNEKEATTDLDMDLGSDFDEGSTGNAVSLQNQQYEHDASFDVEPKTELGSSSFSASETFSGSDLSSDSGSDYVPNSKRRARDLRKPISKNLKLSTNKSKVCSFGLGDNGNNSAYSNSNSNGKKLGLSIKLRFKHTPSKHPLSSDVVSITKNELSVDSEKFTASDYFYENKRQKNIKNETFEPIITAAESKLPHATGSARTEGCYKIPKCEKFPYLLPLLPYLHWSNNFYSFLKTNKTYILKTQTLGLSAYDSDTNCGSSVIRSGNSSSQNALDGARNTNYYFYNSGSNKTDNVDSKRALVPTTSTSGSTSRSHRAANRKLRAQINQYKTSVETDVDGNKAHSRQTGETSLAGSSSSNILQILNLNSLESRTKDLFFAKSGIHNFGLFSRETIYAGEFVIEYIGERIRSSLADHREKRYTRMGLDQDCCYLFRVDHETVVDATVMGNIARFVNHSCNPNCIAKIIVVDGSKRIGIYARTDISIGDEITYDYKFSIEDTDEKIPCLCGSATCRGYLN